MECLSLILSDDLTGALDSAVGFAGDGTKVIVARNPGAVTAAMAQRPDVLAINTSSREVCPDVAKRRVAEALATLQPAMFSTIMKKVDSRLKGNIAAELQALIQWMGTSRAVACPAIPSMGRRVEGGALVGAGVDAPIDVSARMGMSAGAPDVQTDADIDRLVYGEERTLWIGARGLAFALARRAGIAAPMVGRLNGPIMIANGSRDPVTLAQIDNLPDWVLVLRAPDGLVVQSETPAGSFVVSISDGGAGLTGGQAAAELARSIRSLADAAQPASLLICGGESAQSALDLFDADCLQVTAELCPGLPLFEIAAPWGRLRVATKSGGFGDAGLLADILRNTDLQGKQDG